MTQEVESTSVKRVGVGSGSVGMGEGGSVDRGRVEYGGLRSVRNSGESQDGGKWD